MLNENEIKSENAESSKKAEPSVSENAEFPIKPINIYQIQNDNSPLPLSPFSDDDEDLPLDDEDLLGDNKVLNQTRNEPPLNQMQGEQDRFLEWRIRCLKRQCLLKSKNRLTLK